MGTRIELHRFDPGDDGPFVDARRAVEAVDDALTIHRRSPATALNARLAVERSAPVDDPLLFDALVAIDDLWATTEGLFDPSVGAAEERGLWAAVRIDRPARRIMADRPVAFDFGGFGKGFALDRAGDALRRAGVRSAFLSAGESSIAVIGSHPLGGPWPLAIPHPLDPDAWLVELELEDSALSVSATVGAGSDAPGRAAMVRPTDGAVIDEPVLAIAIEPTGAQAEAMSTALLVGCPQSAGRLRSPCPARRHRFTFADARPRASSPVGSR